MRARKLDALATDDLPPPDDVADAWSANEEASEDEESGAGEGGGRPTPGPIARLCIECGADDCREHGEIARIDAPSRALHDAVARLKRVAAERRAATRALRVLVLSEVARGRGDLETRLAPKAEPCPRCLIRDAEAAAAASGVTRATTRRAKGDSGQRTLPFKAP
jgi:hypothetical protein